VDTLELTGRSLAVEDVERVALGDVQVVLGASAVDQIEAARGGAQVSTNLIDIDATPLAAVVDEIERLAAERGVGVKGSELVGLMPARVAAAAAGTALRLSGFGADRLLEVASGGEFGEG
jgi:glutamate formiminotransferase